MHAKLVGNCRLNSEESIQMVTALALQLIQSVVTLPRHQVDQYPDEVQDEDTSYKKKKSKHKHGQV